MRFVYLLSTCLFFIACQNTPPTTSQKPKKTAKKPTDVGTIMARKQVPILCYHQIRDWRASDSESAKVYIVPPANFKEQIKMLADSGYQTILPDQLIDYLTTGAKLPAKPVMLTFDDNTLEQFTVAAPELKKYGFKAVFFIMTVSINRPKYLSSEQIKALSDAGHIIASHSWDHQNFKKYQAADWITQVEKPTKRLQEITGKPVKYFAYPFGLWDAEGIPELKKRGFTAAFQLSVKRDEKEPLFTIRRNIASGGWDGKKLNQIMINNF